jgi:hypothetical protein
MLEQYFVFERLIGSISRLFMRRSFEGGHRRNCIPPSQSRYAPDHAPMDAALIALADPQIASRRSFPMSTDQCVMQ